MVRRYVRSALWDKVPRDHWQTQRALRRRQIVTLTFVVIGAVVLGLSLRLEPGSPWFYPATLALAGVWAVGAFASGPLYLGRIQHGDRLQRPIVTGIGLGLALAALFVVGSLVVREIPWLHDQVRSVLDHADAGVGPLIVVITFVNGVAEELFFRGALYAATTKHPVAVTTVVYAVATLATGNLMLGFAALLLGAVVGLERRASGGLLGPMLTHVTWSVSMLFVLPLIL